METYFDRAEKKVYKPKNIEPAKRESVYGVIIHNNNVLLQNPCWNKFWELPGGGINKGEKKSESLIREIKEEVGVCIHDVEEKEILRKKQNFYAEDQQIFYKSTMFFYKINIFDSQNIRKQKKEVNKIKWINISELDKFNVKKIHLEAIMQSLV